MEQQRQFTKLNFSETPDPRGQSVPDTPRAAEVVGGYLTEAAADLLYEPLGGSGFRGALVKKTADQTAADYTTRTAIAWDGETYDTDAIHDNATNNTRLTVPTGVTYVRLSAGIQIVNFTADLWMRLSLQKNGSLNYDGSTQANTEAGITTLYLNLMSPVLPVTAGDYFEITLQVETDTSIDITAARTWFAMEIVA